MINLKNNHIILFIKINNYIIIKYMIFFNYK